jgi:sulfonate transport system substrate-binding protein
MNFDRRKLLFAGAGLGSLGLLGACAPKAEGGPVKLIVGDQVHLVQARLEASGALSGLKGYGVEWASFVGAAPLLEALNAGAVDTAFASDLPVIFSAAAGVPLKIVAAIHSSTKSVAIIVPKGSKAQSVADLRGKKVVVSTARGSVSHYLLLGALEEAGLKPADITLGFMMPADAGAAFATGQIDAWAIFGVYQAKAEADGARILRDGEGINTGIGVIAASDKALASPQKRAAIADFTKRLEVALNWTRANPEAYAKIFAEKTGVSLDIARVIVARDNSILVPIDESIISALQVEANRFHAYGALAKPVDISKLIAKV